MGDNYVIATVKSWNIANFEKMKAADGENNWFLIDQKDDLTLDNLIIINPKYVFFPHWSWIIPESLYNSFECVVFHMTDLPFGRGGSPLQNLISRGIYQTKISAISVEEGLDTGEVYCKEPFSLEEGNANELFKAASEIVFFKMIPFIISSNPTPKKQKGEIVVFERRTPDQGNLSALSDLKKVYDYIRMLHGEGYNKAFIETDYLKIDFYNVKKSDDELIANCRIKLRDSDLNE